MPPNPDKKRCAVSGCRNWAMRGHTRCRSHRDAELGARGAGAPPNNLNALKHGRHSHPLPLPDLERLAVAIIKQPGELPDRVGLVARAIYARANDPVLTLIATGRLLSLLASRVAAGLFDRQFQAHLHDLPAPLRERVRSIFEQLDPVERLILLKKIAKTRKTIVGKEMTRPQDD